MSMLVSELQLNRASLYNTFGDKRRLYLDSLARYIANWPIPESGGNQEDPLNLLEATRKRFYAQPDARGCFLLRAAAETGHSDPEVAQLVRDYYTALEKAFRTSIEQAKTPLRGKVATNSREAAKFLITQCYALHGHAVLSTDRKRSRELVEVALKALN